MKHGDKRLTESEKKLSALFPFAGDVPESVAVHDQKHQRQILIDGELREWSGPVHDVFSPLRIRGSRNGKLESTLEAILLPR